MGYSFLIFGLFLALIGAMIEVGQVNDDAESSYNIAIGVRAGIYLGSGSSNILLGAETNTPTPQTSNYVNLWNTIKVSDSKYFAAFVRGGLRVFFRVGGLWLLRQVYR